MGCLSFESFRVESFYKKATFIWEGPLNFCECTIIRKSLGLKVVVLKVANRL